MHTVFITDDEEVTRNGLVRLYDWAKLGLEVVGEADDGTTALPRLEALRPDILLTDVKMLFMDGIELARRALALLPDLKIVFISGYDDVDYVRSALKMGACDYILKPVEFPELEACLSKVVERLDSEWLSRSNLQEMERRLHMSQPLMKDRFFASILGGQLVDDATIRERLDYFGVPYRDKPVTALILSPDEGEVDRCQGFQQNWPLLSVAIRNISEEILANHGGGLVMEDPAQARRFAAALLLEEGIAGAEQAYAVAAEIRDMLRLHLQLTISVGIGPLAGSWAGLRESYLAAGNALKHRLYLGGGRILTADEGAPPPAASPQSPVTELALHSLLLEENEEPLRRHIDAYFDGLLSTQSTDVTFYRGKVSQAVFQVFTTLREQLSGSEDSDLSQQNVLELLYNTESVAQMRELLHDYCSDVRALIRLKNDGNTKTIISRVQKLIQEQFCESLTISDLAQDVYLTPTYLCVLFRQEVGMTINSYHTFVRMEKAKELLADLSNKLYDISFAVGYSNPSYFSRQFKKHTGLLPSDYRNRVVQ